VTPGFAACVEGRRATHLLRAAALSLLLVSAATLAAAQSPPGGEAEVVPLPAGTELRLLASPAAPVVVTLVEPVEAEVVDRHRGWLRLAAGGADGWWHPEAETVAEDSATDSAPPEQAASGGDPAAGSLLAAVRDRMGGAARTLPLGPFHLVTDLTDEAEVEALRALVGGLVRHYHQRYGLPVPPEVPVWGDDGGPAVVDQASAAGTVVLLADPADYRAVVDNDRLPAQTISGVALLAADPAARITRRLLAHEVAHLLNRFAFSAAPPAWLDEGLAGDLELTPTLDDGRLLSGPLDRRAVRSAGGGRPYGPLIALERLHRAARQGRLETLPDLAALDTDALMASPRGPDLYALSALWTRFLLDDRTPKGRHRAAVFRTYLTTVAASPTLPPLPAALADPAVDADFHRWLIDLARRTEPIPKRPQ